MVTSSNVVAIVPARGGSKSIPRKNIRLLGGVPLLAYSIEAARQSRWIDRVIVSTDDPEIAAVAQAWGADVPFLRPANIAEDATPDLPVFEHAVQWLETHEGQAPEIVVQLRPTSPLRPPDCVDDAVAMLRDDLSADSVRGVVLASQNPYKMWHIQPDGAMVPLIGTSEAELYNRARQELPVTHWQTGHVDAIRTATIREQRSISGARIKGLEIDPAYTCDIDTDMDWARAEWLLEHLDRPLVRPRPPAPQFPDDVRMIVFDFDGVITDNRVWVTAGGLEWVACNRSDGIGLAAMRRLGIELLVLSTETHPVVGERCAKLGVPCEQGVEDKGRRLGALLGERGIDAAQVIYVGNDTNDLDCLRLAGCAVAVADAHPVVLAEVDVVLTKPGGHGAVRELCDRIQLHVSSRTHHAHSDTR